MKKNKNDIIFYFGFVLLVLLRFINSSILLDLPVIINYILLILICLLFIVKIVLDKHTLKEYMVLIVLSIFSLYLYKVCGIYYFLTTLLSIFSLKGVEIKKVVKIDVFMKLFILLSHTFFYFLNYSFNYFEIQNLIKISVKGISHSLYFTNPNTVGALMVWLIFDIFYLISLKRKIKIQDLLIGFVFLYISYLICKSRTPIYIYILFVIFISIKNKRIIHLLSKYSYFILGLISLSIILYANTSSKIFISINTLLSSRLTYSIIAYNKYGFSLLPNALANGYSQALIIDNFYVRCFINYGAITFLFMGVINLFIPKDNYSMEKKLFILSSIYLFFETITVNTGFAIPLLLMGDIIFNKNHEDKN